MSNMTKHGFIQPIEDEKYNISIFNENFEKLDKIITDIYATITNKPEELKVEIGKLVKVGTEIDKDAPKNASLLELIRWIDSTVGKEVSLINQYVTKEEFNLIIKKYITKLDILRYKLIMLENIIINKNYINHTIYDFTDDLNADLINSAKITMLSVKFTGNEDNEREVLSTDDMIIENRQEKLNDSIYNGRDIYGYRISNNDDATKEYIWHIDNIQPGKYSLYVDYYGNDCIADNVPSYTKIYKSTTNSENNRCTQDSNIYYPTALEYDSTNYPYNFYNIDVTEIESKSGIELSVILNKGESINLCMHLVKNYNEEYEKIVKMLDGLFNDTNIDSEKITEINQYLDDVNKYIFGSNALNIGAQEKINILDKYYLSISNLFTFIKDDIYNHGYKLTSIKELFNYFDLIIRSLEFKIISYYIYIDDILRKTIDLSNILNPSIQSYTVDCYGEWSGDDYYDHDTYYSLTQDGCDDIGEFAYDYNNMMCRLTNTSYSEKTDDEKEIQTHILLKTSSYNKYNDVIINTRKGRSLINIDQFSNITSGNDSGKINQVKFTLNDFTIFVEDYSDNIPKVKPIKITKNSVNSSELGYAENGVLYDSSKITFNTDEIDKCTNTGTNNGKLINKKRHIMRRIATKSELGHDNRYENNSQIYVDSMYINLELTNNSAIVKVCTYPTPYTLAYIQVTYRLGPNYTRLYSEDAKILVSYYTNSQKYNIFNYSFDADEFANQSYVGSLGSKIFYLDSDKNLLSKYRLMNVNQSNLNITENNVIFDDKMYTHVNIQYVHEYDKLDNGNCVDHMMIAYNNMHMIPVYIRGKLYYVDLSHSTYDMYIDYKPDSKYTLQNSDVIVNDYIKSHINYSNTSIDIAGLRNMNGSFFVLCIAEDELNNIVITPHIKIPLIDDFNSSKMIILDAGKFWHIFDINDSVGDGLVSYPFNTDDDIKWLSQRMGGCLLLNRKNINDNIEQYRMCIEHDLYSDMVSFIHNNYNEEYTVMADGSYNMSIKYPIGGYANGNKDIKSDIVHYVKDNDRYYMYDRNNDEFIEVNPVTAKSMFLSSVNDATNKVLSDINLDDSAYEKETTDIVVYDSLKDAANAFGTSIDNVEPDNGITPEGRKDIHESQIFGVKNIADNSIDKYRYIKWKLVGIDKGGSVYDKYSGYTYNAYDSKYCEHSNAKGNTWLKEDEYYTNYKMNIYTYKYNNNDEYICISDNGYSYIPFGKPTFAKDSQWCYEHNESDTNYYRKCNVKTKYGTPVAIFYDDAKSYLDDYVDKFGADKSYDKYIDKSGEIKLTTVYKNDDNYNMTLSNNDIVINVYTEKYDYSYKNYYYYCKFAIWQFVNRIEKVTEETKSPDMSMLVNNITDKCSHAFGMPYTMTNLYMYQNAIVKNLNDNLQKLIDDGIIIDTGTDTWVSEVFTNVRGVSSSTRKNPGNALFYIHKNSKQLEPFFNSDDEYLLKVEYSPIDADTVGLSTQVELTTMVINLSSFNQCRIDDIRSKDPFILNGYIDTKTNKYYHSKKVQDVINDINNGYTSISILSPKPMWNKDPYRVGVFDPYPFRYRKIKEVENVDPLKDSTEESDIAKNEES